MVIERKQILDLIYNSIDEMQDIWEKEAFDKTENLRLYGNGGLFDSLGLIRFTLSVEQKIGKLVGRNVSLLDTSVFLKNENPFSDVSSFLSYILKKLNNQ